MSPLPKRLIASIALIGLAAAAGGCTRLRSHQGYIVDADLVNSVQPGVDNKDSVLKTLGTPSFSGQFSDNVWYYIARDSRNLAFNRPRPETQTTLKLTFDQAGNVTSVDKTGAELVASIQPSDDSTPTLGRRRGFFQDLFGNIGTVGAPGAGPGGGGPGGPN
ncbi:MULTISPECIES: outer membrane protein assembly factor BamE [unclassified Sphingomonas]|uniref:outer membrane protein assembly factor BamE n=1 Tax=unclassified Sphingomonas TaxID=196159 RepID=UPI00082BD968|nr:MULTISPECIES: outer membrane protein assembly factor BamE [unclassified Sphingomonas]MCH4893366.1 outer membrane protein assembly factor BamE [Sphingomonas sp. SFZ2018-12]